MGARFCLIGKNLPHTLSPRIHAAFGRDDYAVVELDDESALQKFVKSGEYAGFNVTMPFKRGVLTYLDALTDTAREVGAVNAVLNAGGRLIGDNTDVAGMKYALDRAGIALGGKNVMILGSGATSCGAQYLARREGAKRVYVVSRTGALNYQNCYEVGDAEVIINATPVGTSPRAYERLVDVAKFPHLQGVMDVVYDPLATLFAQQAEAAGIAAACGLDMLVEQARLSHNMFCTIDGTAQPPEASAEVCAQLKRDLCNIVLVGMAGAGKSSVGRELAALLGREFEDTDEIVVKKRGKSIPDIFAEEGEAAFREYEAEAVRECCLGKGKVIATGGGAVLRSDNRFFMRANGKVVHILRDVDSLATEGRPLYADDDSVRRIFAERKAVYESVADITVRNDGDAQSAAKRILKELAK